MRSSRSRLNRRLERQTRKNLVLTLVGIAVILFSLFKFGLPLLINLSFLVSGNKNEQAAGTSGPSFVAAPILNSTYSATSSATLQSVSGNAMKDMTVSLYINGSIADKVTVKENGTFEFKDVTLTTGENLIRAKAKTKENKESDFSNTLVVIYKNSSPKLSIETPGDNQSFGPKDDNPIKVAGKTDPGNKVTVNDFWALVDSEGNYSYYLKLSNGDNHIAVVATDPAGNFTKTERTVKYSQ